jgi:uncharacterized coiled-coil protein SlyX
MAEHNELLARIARLSSRASFASEDDRLLSEIEDVLAEGYVEAMTGEARSRSLARRMDDLVERIDEPAVAVEARRIAVQRRTLDQRVRDLRAQLAVMREHFVRLGGGQSARS